jgi:hypothetical protein
VDAGWQRVQEIADETPTKRAARVHSSRPHVGLSS